MKKVHAILAAAVLGTSALAMPARADEFKKTTFDDIPREARDAIRDKTKDKDNVEVFTRKMSDGETQYTTFYMDDGRRMEMRVDKDGKVVSPAHETREQPGEMKDKDKDKDKDKEKDKDKDKEKNKDRGDRSDDAANPAKDYKRESEELANMPKPAQETINKETASATDQGYYRLRRDGHDIYSVFFTPKDGQRQELRVDKDGKVVSRHLEEPEAVARTNEKPNDDAAQPAGARQPAAGAPVPPARKAPTTAPAADDAAAAKNDGKPVLTPVKRDALPDAVRKAFEFQTRDAMNVQYNSGMRGGKTFYTVWYTPKGSTKQMELRTDAEGKPLEEPHQS